MLKKNIISGRKAIFMKEKLEFQDYRELYP